MGNKPPFGEPGVNDSIVGSQKGGLSTEVAGMALGIDVQEIQVTSNPGLALGQTLWYVCERPGFSSVLNDEGVLNRTRARYGEVWCNLAAWFLWWEVQPNHDHFLEKNFTDSSFAFENEDVDRLPEPLPPMPNGRIRQ